METDAPSGFSAVSFSGSDAARMAVSFSGSDAARVTNIDEVDWDLNKPPFAPSPPPLADEDGGGDGDGDDDDLSPVAVAVPNAGGRVLIEAAALASEDYRDRVVDAEDIVWRHASAAQLAGVGGAVVLRHPPSAHSVLFDFDRLHRRRRKSRAVLDIEDAGEVPRMCGRCQQRPKANLGGMHDALRRSKRVCFEPADSRGEGQTAGACALDAPFPECALCARGCGLPSSRPCVACGVGLRIVAKNTFLTTAEEDDIDEEEAEPHASRRRSLSF